MAWRDRVDQSYGSERDPGMTELTRPIRRLLSRSEGPDATPLPVTPAVIETAIAADIPSIAVDIAESDPLVAKIKPEMASISRCSRHSTTAALSINYRSGSAELPEWMNIGRGERTESS